MVKIPLSERGDYYRGLLVLIRRDRVITEEEREAMIRIGERLDFDRRFCESTIDELLINPYITRKPVRFSDQSTAESFLRNAISLAFVDRDLHPKELAWLKRVARANGLDDQWLAAEISKHLS